MPRIVPMILACSAAILLLTKNVIGADVAPFVIGSEESASDVSLVSADRRGATIYIDAKEPAVVRHAAQLLSADVNRVAGQPLPVTHDAAALRGVSVLIGT